MIKSAHLIKHLFSIVVISQAVKIVNVSADMHVDKTLLSGKELKVAITNVLKILLNSFELKVKCTKIVFKN